MKNLTESELDRYYTKKAENPPNNQRFDDYICDSLIAETNGSLIYSGYNTNCKTLNNKIIFKFIKRIKGKEHQIENEIEIMENLNHPHILKHEFKFSYRQYVCIITKYAHHGSLLDIIAKYGKGIREDLARIAMHQMLEAVHYLHSNRIWHRDIKPENFLVYSWVPEPILVVLADFGYSKVLNDDELSTDYIGTYNYAAPEIYKNQPYSKSADMWSLGITLFFMLAGRLPFSKYEDFPEDNYNKVTTGKLNLNILQLNSVSLDAISLIEQMCKLDPNERCTAEQALQHTWFKVPQKLTHVESLTTNHLYGEDITYI